MSWTPGPWTLKTVGRTWAFVADDDGYTVARVAATRDAALIAAAPEMAALLEFIHGNGYEPPETAGEIGELLSRIRGEA